VRRALEFAELFRAGFSVSQELPSSVRFGSFTLDLKSGELRKNGASLRIAPQPSKVLVLLASRAGQIVTREELREHTWSQDTFVDFDKGLNFCIKQIRTALRDDADRPTFIETLPRRGYRFIAPVETTSCGEGESAQRKDENLAIEVSTARPMAPANNRRTWFLLVAMLSLFTIGYGSFYKSRTLNFPNRGWVLIAAFENRTGESILDGTIEAALQRELSESRFVSVLPEARIQDALWLMGKDKRTVLEPDVAREVALRDGNTALLLTGRIEKLGHIYLLSTSLVEPTTGVLKRSLSEEARDQDAILQAVHRLARRVRDTVGDKATEIQGNTQVLEKATTPSLRALQLYSKGIAFINQDEWVEGTEMFNRALREDPDFASAHIYLAWCYANAGKNKQALPHFEKASELADRTSDRERYFILGSYYEAVKQDLNQAIEQYEVLTRLYPDDFWGTNNLADDLLAVGREEDALPYIVRRAESRPNDPDLNYAAWEALSKNGGDSQRARFFLERARALAATSEASKRPARWAQLQFVAADQYLREGDAVRSLQELDRVATKLDSVSGERRTLFLDELGNRYFNLGRLHDAERYFRQMPEGMQHIELVLLAQIRGEKETLRKELLAQFAAGDQLGPGTAARLAREGFFSQAERVLAAPLMSRIEPRSRVQGARGELAFARGRRQEGLREMSAAWQSLRPLKNDQAIMNAQFLSDALSQSGNPIEAIQVLEQQLADQPDRLAFAGITGCEEQLVRLYRVVGRENDAQAMELKLRQQLSVADADHPLLSRLRTPQNIAAAH
jgi:DNA-binding winged helix-turn-helix (wHTH) protein/tetratricopeptide (TPR) repeat protein